MADYKIKKLDTAEYQNWDQFVDESKEGSLFHKSFWLDASGLNFDIIGCYTGNELRAGGVFPEKQKFGISVVSNPVLTPYTGVIFEQRRGKRVTALSNEKRMSEKIIKYAKEKYSNIKINLSPNYKDLQPFIWNGFESKVRYTYLMDLSNLDEIWNQMDSGSCRNSIKRAKKDGLKVKITDDFETMLNLVEMTFNRQDMTIDHFKDTAWKYFKVLKRKKLSKSFICYDNHDRPIGGVFIVWDNSTSYYLLGGYDPEHGHHGASTLAMWEAIQYSSEELGLNQFDFEGSMIRSVENFFRKFGGVLTPYYHVSASNIFYKLINLVRTKIIN